MIDGFNDSRHRFDRGDRRRWMGFEQQVLPGFVGDLQQGRDDVAEPREGVVTIRRQQVGEAAGNGDYAEIGREPQRIGIAADRISHLSERRPAGSLPA